MADGDCDEFAKPIGRGMNTVPPGRRVTLRSDDLANLESVLDDFDAARTRGDVESRNARVTGRRRP